MADGILTSCNVAGGSGITCHWIRPNVRHTGILHLALISTTSPQSTCPAPVTEISSKSDDRRQKKITSCRFSRWRISAILDFMGPIMGSLKSPGTTSYRSSIETIALNCLFFEKIAFLHFGDRQTDRLTDKQTNEQMDSTDALSRSRCRERRLNNSKNQSNIVGKLWATEANVCMYFIMKYVFIQYWQKKTKCFPTCLVSIAIIANYSCVLHKYWEMFVPCFCAEVLAQSQFGKWLFERSHSNW